MPNHHHLPSMKFPAAIIPLRLRADLGLLAVWGAAKG